MTAIHKKILFRLRQALIGSFITKPQPKPLVFLGPGSALQLSRAIGRFGLRKILIVTDKPLRELGVMNATLAALHAAGVDTAIYDGVLPDPTQHVVDQGIEVYLQAGCDSVLAFGGGSSIDAAKVIALGVANNLKRRPVSARNNASGLPYRFSRYRPPPVPGLKLPSLPSFPTMRLTKKVA